MLSNELPPEGEHISSSTPQSQPLQIFEAAHETGLTPLPIRLALLALRLLTLEGNALLLLDRQFVLAKPLCFRPELSGPVHEATASAIDTRVVEAEPCPLRHELIGPFLLGLDASGAESGLVTVEERELALAAAAFTTGTR